MHFKKYKNQAVLSNRKWSETTTGPSHKVSSCFVSIRLLHSVSSDDEVVLHYTYGELPSVIKRIPWLTDSNKLIQAICFDPTATWLLVVSIDGSLYIIPALSLADKKQKIDCKWSLNDLTHFPKHSQTPDSKPTCVVWWQTLDSNQNALVGYESGAIALVSLTDGRCLGCCAISEAVTRLSLCQDNTLDSVSLLVLFKTICVVVYFLCFW
jgi:WD40 repeat protein